MVNGRRTSGKGTSTAEQVFGPYAIGSAEMTNRLWRHVRDHVPHEKLEATDAEAELIVKQAAGRPGLTVTETTALVMSRRGQGQFRVDLMKRWGGRCAVTECCETRVLRASHLKPWERSSNAERLDSFNGLLLAPHLDALSDCGLITFADDGTILISSSLTSADAKCLGIHRSMRLRSIEDRHRCYLGFHRIHVFQE
jgi:hypothetical protein